MSSKLAYDAFRLSVIRTLSSWLPNNTVIWDHQPTTGNGGTSHVNTETWLAVETGAPKHSKLGYNFISNGARAYKGSFRSEVLLRFYGPGSQALLLELRDKLQFGKSDFLPVVWLAEGTVSDATTFLGARWERRANTSMTFSVCYEIAKTTTTKLIDKIESSGTLIEADLSELEQILSEV